MAKRTKGNTNSTAGTTTITNNGYVLTNGTSNTISFSAPKFKYVVLGEEVEQEGHCGDAQTGMCIALINVLGIKYYDELKKQRISFSGNLGDFLEEKLKAYYRDNKIEEMLNS